MFAPNKTAKMAAQMNLRRFSSLRLIPLRSFALSRDFFHFSFASSKLMPSSSFLTAMYCKRAALYSPALYSQSGGIATAFFVFGIGFLLCFFLVGFFFFFLAVLSSGEFSSSLSASLSLHHLAKATLAAATSTASLPACKRLIGRHDGLNLGRSDGPKALQNLSCPSKARLGLLIKAQHSCRPRCCKATLAGRACETELEEPFEALSFSTRPWRRGDKGPGCFGAAIASPLIRIAMLLEEKSWDDISKLV